MIGIDTNLLVYTHRSGTPEHGKALKAMEYIVRNPSGWGVAFSCLTEFWGVVTHPRCVGGPSTPTQATSFIHQLIEDGGGHIWLPGSGFGMRLLKKATDLNLGGPRIFDLQIGLIAHENGATALWSYDKNFVVIPGLELVNPDDQPFA
ncbi:MAG TPA: hypothetical protein PKA21_04750 [Kiritimatiellia bacterium]|nr:hypothetical protein [Kiritimatiellia bacterium]